MKGANDAARMIEIIDSRIKRLTRSLAGVETSWGVVAARNTIARTVDVYLDGSATASEDFRIRGGAVPAVSVVVKVAIDKRTGDRWIEEPIFAAGSPDGTDPVSLSHDDLLDVTPNQHHAEVHAIDGADHTGNLSADEIAVVPFGSIAATDVQTALEEVYAEASGGVTDHGALTGLGDDDHPQYDTHAEVLATKLDDFAAPDDNTDLDASTFRHGLLPKVTGSDGGVPTKSGTSVVWGPGGAAAAQVPYLLGAGETFTVPAGKQALFADTIELVGDAVLVVDGELIEVDAPKAVETVITTSGVAGQVPTANGLGRLEMRYPAIPGVHMLSDGGGEGEPGLPGPPGPVGPPGTPTADGAWTAYTPTLTATSVNPTLGSSSLTGLYKMLGSKTCAFRIYLLVNTGGGWNAGTGGYRFALPFAAHGTGAQVVGAFVVDSGTAYYAPAGVYITQSDTKTGPIIVRTGVEVTHNTPMTPATNDEIVIEGVYEIA